MDGYDNPRHVKAKAKSTPQKADHKHVYVRRYKMSRIQYNGGRISDDEFMFPLPIECEECGHRVKANLRNIRGARDVQISHAEYNERKAAK